MYKKITIKGFRAIKDLTVEDFRQVNLFVGKNNCGKSTVLEALFLSTAPTNAALPLRINLFRGIKHIDENTWRLIFNRFIDDPAIEISSEWDNPLEERDLVIEPDIKTISFDNLKSTIDKNEIDFREIDIKDSYHSYSGLAASIRGLTLKYSFSKKENKKKPIKEVITTKIISEGSTIDVETPKSYKEQRRGIFINSTTIFGGDTSTRFNNVQITKQTDKIVNILKQIEPSLENLSLGTNGIIYCDIGLSRLIPINSMGDGIFRILCIALATLDTANGSVFIDEIENGLHYSSQKILWDALFKMAKEFNVQIFATTHSNACIKAFNASYEDSQLSQDNDNIRLYRIERKDDDFRVVTYDNKTLAASLDSDWEVR